MYFFNQILAVFSNICEDLPICVQLTDKNFIKLIINNIEIQ